ncbi:MAG: aminoglycoside phosphotransferase family protein [Thermomicrobiales bacterium]
MDDADRMMATITRALDRLGMEGSVDPACVRRLTSGMSGSEVIAFCLDDRDVVMKRTVARAGGALDPRAVREVRFYRDLAAVVPVTVPGMIGSFLDDQAEAMLLLAACEPPPPPDAWGRQDLEDVAFAAGRFHALMRDVPRPGWLQPASVSSTEDCVAAVAGWRAFVAGPGAGLIADDLLQRMVVTIRAVPSRDRVVDLGPQTLCHGDFHAGNLLRGPGGGWVWADWQEVHVGPGVNDLAFFWQRLFASSDRDMTPMFPVLIEAYWFGLNAAGEAGMRRDALERALAWSELRGWLLAWPPYLGYLAPDQRARVLGRITRLLDGQP